MKGNNQVDAIKLVVTQVASVKQKHLKKAKKEWQEKKKEIESLNANITLLDAVQKELIGTSDQAGLIAIQKKLEEGGLKDLVSKLKLVDSAKPDVADRKLAYKSNIDEERKKPAADNELNLKELAALDSTILKLATPDDIPFYKGLWQRSDINSDFNFALPRRLEMAETYVFEFSLFIKNKTALDIDKFLGPLISDFNSKLQTDGYYAADKIKPRVQQAIDDIKTTTHTNLLTVDSVSHDFKEGFTVDANKVDKLTGLIENYYVYKDGINSSTDDETSTYQAILTTMNARPQLTAIHKEEMLDIINEKNLIASAVARNRKSFEAVATADGFAAITVTGMLTNYDALVKAREEIEKEKSAAKKYFDDIQGEFNFIKELFVKNGAVIKEGQTGSTDVEGIQLSTVYGVAAIFLDNSPTIELPMFVAVNFRFAEFDNRIEKSDAYKRNFWSRASLMVGMATTSNLEYKGKDLENTGLGFKPLVGFHYEPIKHVNVGVGFIFFTQEPIGNVQRNPVMRPYVSIGWDFNLFNYLIQKN